MTAFFQNQLVFLLCGVALGAPAQTRIDPKRVAQIDTAIARAMPFEETRWWIGRNRMDDHELVFRRDTFRVKQMRCQLMGNMAEEGSMEYLVAVYQYTALLYDQLIDKYDALMQKCTLPEYKARYLQSQQLWLAYRQQTLGLFGEDNVENYDKANHRLVLNQNRLEEIYFFYSELDFEGLIQKN